MDLTNLQSFDAFADAEEESGDQSKVHIRVQQRNGRKCITLIEGLADDLDVKRICKAFKKNFSCNGAVTKDEEMGEVIQLSGDQVCARSARAAGFERPSRGEGGGAWPARADARASFAVAPPAANKREGLPDRPGDLHVGADRAPRFLI